MKIDKVIEVVVANTQDTSRDLIKEKIAKKIDYLPQQFITSVKKLSNIKGSLLIIFLWLLSVQKNEAAN